MKQNQELVTSLILGLSNVKELIISKNGCSMKPITQKYNGTIYIFCIQTSMLLNNMRDVQLINRTNQE